MIKSFESFLGCSTFQQHASVSKGRICSVIVLPHWDRSCRSEWLSHPVTAYWQHASSPSTEHTLPGARQGNPGVPVVMHMIRLDRGKRGVILVCAALQAAPLLVGWFACLTSQQHASVSPGRICTILRAATLKSNFLPHPVPVYWHRADQSRRWSYNARRLAG